jgi:hypothetical protein
VQPPPKWKNSAKHRQGDWNSREESPIALIAVNPKRLTSTTNMTSIITLSQSDTDESSVTSCAGCPLARHLYEDKYACGNALEGVVTSRQPLTSECHDAILNHPERHFQPLPLPNLQGIDPELVCSYIGVSLNWLNVYGDEIGTQDGEEIIEVSHQGIGIGDLKKRGDYCYCDRIKGIESVDAYLIALHMVHPDFLYGVVEEMIAGAELAIDYM